MQLTGLQVGHYQLQQQLGRGGMGVVYLAGDQHLSRQVALKMIRPDIHPVELPKALRLFDSEAQAIAQLKHPHILPLYDYNTVDVQGIQVPYMVMPFCKDGSLEAWLHVTPLLSPQVVASLVLQVADALQHAHDKGIIHRDVKPGNILLEQLKGTVHPYVYLTDFGIAAIMDGATSTGQVIRGSLPYMAPEQLEGWPTFATDQYALAVTAYLLVTGKTPFGGNPQLPSALNPALSQQVDMVILKGLAKKPTDRFPTVSIFAEALQSALQHDSMAPTYPAAHHSHPTASFSGQTTYVNSLPQPPPLIISTPASSMKASSKPMPTPAIDGNEVLERVHRKNIPSAWRVFYPTTSGVVWRLIRLQLLHMWCFFIAFGWNAVACSPSLVTVMCYPPNQHTLPFWGLWPLNALIILYSLVMWIAYRKEVLVLMPEGLMLYSCAWPFWWKQTHTIDYGMVEVMYGDSTPFYLDLGGFVTHTFKRTDGVMKKIRIDIGFGEVDTIMKAITDAYHQFMGNAPSSLGITLFTYRGHARSVHDVAWSPDGSRIVSGGTDKTVQIWNALSGEQLAIYRGHSDRVNAVIWSPDNTRIASVGIDRKVKVWDVATGYNTVTYSDHSSEIFGVAWSPDNTRIASASTDRTIRIWNAASGKLVVKCRTPSISFLDTFFSSHNWATVRWSPDGTRLASAICVEGAGIQIWKANGEHIYTYKG